MLGTSISGYVGAVAGGPAGVAVAVIVGLLENEARKPIDIIKEDRRNTILNSANNDNLMRLEFKVNNGSIKDNFEVISMPTSVMTDFLTGRIKTMTELNKAIWSDESAYMESNSALLIEYSPNYETIYVHKAFMDTSHSTELKTDDKKK